MKIKQEGERWVAKKSNKAKRWEDITDLMQWHGEFVSVMGKAGLTNFHAYLGKHGKGYSQLYGVTSVLNYWGEKEGLLQWAVNQAVDFIENGGDTKTARKAHKMSLKKAGDAGTDTHQLVEDYILALMSNDAPDNEMTEQVKLFANWATDNKVKFLASEMPVFSKALWVAGTMDFLCEIDGKLYIGDVKTSNYINPKHFYQCGAYAGMYEEMTDSSESPVEGIVIVHLPRDGGITIHKRDDVDKYRKAFENILYTLKIDKDESYQLGFR